MKAEARSRLGILRDDYQKTRGQLWNYFFCPILFRDEEVDLCKAHIVNQAFPNSSRVWTLQRKDVDQFYGANFESDFVDTQHVGIWSASEVLSKRSLRRKLEMKITVDDQVIGHYFPKDTQVATPNQFTRIELESAGQRIPLILKMSSKEFEAGLKKKWEFNLAKDMRLPAFVSLIKAAHLTLFHILGYQYALSASGYFIGRQVLGEFFLQNKAKAKSEVIRNALTFFDEYVHIVRPVQSSGFGLLGTVTDKIMLVCDGAGSSRWAFIVFIKMAQNLSAVMIPILDQPEAASTYYSFLRSNHEMVDANFCQFTNEQWLVDQTTYSIPWPKQGIGFHEKVG